MTFLYIIKIKKKFFFNNKKGPCILLSLFNFGIIMNQLGFMNNLNNNMQIYFKLMIKTLYKSKSYSVKFMKYLIILINQLQQKCLKTISIT